MHLDRISIKGFGKLKNREISFRKGMNVIYGANEAGKSTVQSFIMAMFYGLKAGRTSASGLPSPRKRFMPWDGEPYGGAVVYTLDNGSTCRIERDFSSNTVVVYDAAYNDITDSFSYGKDKQPMIGETHLGMDEMTFENTVFIRQMGVRLDSSGSTILAARLVNLDSPDIDGLIYQRAEAALTDALKNRVGTERSRIQPLDKLQSELKRLESEHKVLEGRQKEKEKLMQELSEIRAKLRELEKQEHKLAKIGELIEIRKKIDEGMRKEVRLSETVKQLAEIDQALEKLYAREDTRKQTTLQPGTADVPRRKRADSERKRRTGESRRTGVMTVFMLLCIIAALASGVLLFVPLGGRSDIIPASPYFYAAATAICVLAGTILLRGILQRKGEPDAYEGANELQEDSQTDHADDMAEDACEKLAALESVRRNLLSAASAICGIKAGNASDVRAALDEVRSGLESLSRHLQMELDQADRMDIPLPGFFSQEELDVLIYDSDLSWLEAGWKTEMDALRRRLLDTALQEKFCEGQFDDDKGEADRIQLVEEEIAAVRERIARLENTGRALRLAREVLTEAAEEIRLSNAPELNSRMSAIISGLTGGRYADLRGDDRLSLKASDPYERDVRSVSVLSSGTADQMYLALRLAIAGMLTSGGESLPFVMDEVFSQFDDKRTELALKYLYREHRDRQILLFTCKSREVELIREIYGNEMHFVEL